MKKMLFAALMSSAALAVTAPAAAAVTVLNFDDLSGFSLLPTNYGGVDWQDNFVFYTFDQDPFNASSSPSRIFGSYDKFGTSGVSSMAFKVGAGTVFDGFFLAGSGVGSVSFDLYNGATLVASSASVASTSTPTFLASNYTGGITEVRINAVNGYWVGDDFTFSTLNSAGGGGVPEPATWAMMMLGFGLVGAAVRRRGAIHATA